MDEVAERRKLEALDLTEDVIELILEKKRRTYASRISTESGIAAVPEIPEVPADQLEEPTYYPPVSQMETPPVPQPEKMPDIPRVVTHYRWGWFRKK